MVSTRDLSFTLVRFAKESEVASIADILHRAFLSYKELYTPMGFASTAPTPDQIQKRWNEGPVWTALQYNRVVGTVAAVPKGDSLYVRSMAVDPAAQGQGIARLLLEHVEDFARNHEFRRIFLTTTPFLHSAIRLYRRFGLQRTNELPHDLFGTPLFVMEKVLFPSRKNLAFDTI